MKGARRQMAAVVMFAVVLAVFNAGPFEKRSRHPSASSVDRTAAAVIGPVPYAGWVRDLAGGVGSRVEGLEQRRVEGDVVVVGDSLIGDVVAPLRAELAAGGVGVDALIRRGTALAPGDPWGWQDTVSEFVDRHGPPGVVVAMLEPTPGVPVDDPQWVTKASALIDEFASWWPGSDVVWLARPVDDGFERLNAAARSARAVVFIDATSPFVAVTREFTDSVVVDGRLVKVRQRDGLHLSDAGAELFAAEIARRLTNLFHW